jgi:hypothetical protein
METPSPSTIDNGFSMESQDAPVITETLPEETKEEPDSLFSPSTTEETEKTEEVAAFAPISTETEEKASPYLILDKAIGDLQLLLKGHETIRN